MLAPWLETPTDERIVLMSTMLALGMFGTARDEANVRNLNLEKNQL